MKRLKFLIISFLLVTLLLGAVGSAQALEIRSGQEAKVGANETIDDDMFLSGLEVVIDGVVNGDVIANASKVVINGTINGSVIMTGQNLIVNGKVNGSVYGASASLLLGPTTNIKRNVLYAGASFKTEKGSVVGRDVLVAGYQTLIDGEVGRDLKAQGAALEIRGTVKRDIETTVAQPNPGFGQNAFFRFIPGVPAFVDPGIRLLPTAQVGGKLKYTSSVEQANAFQVKPEGGVTYEFQAPDPEDVPDPYPFFTWFVEQVRQFLTLFVLGALVVWRAPLWLKQFSDMAHDDVLSSVGWGLVVWFGGFVVAGLVTLALVVVAGLVWVVTLGELFNFVLTLGGAVLTIALALFWILISYGGKVVLAYFVGSWLSENYLKQITNPYLWLLLGVLLYVIVAAIPVVGWLVGAATTLVGVGAMWLTIRERYQPEAAL